MIRLGDKIRLTANEKAGLDAVAGPGAAPTTVQEHDQILENAAQHWEQQEETPETKLLAALSRGFKVGE